MVFPGMWKLRWFRRTLLFFFVTVCIPTASISAIYLYTESHELRSRYEAVLRAEADRLSENIADLFARTEQFSLQMTFQTNMMSLLNRTDLGSMYDYLKLQNDMKEQIFFGGIVDSAYIYFAMSGRVLTTGEGLYSQEDFYDRHILSEPLGNKPYIINTRESMITFQQELPVSGTQKLGKLIVNMDMRKFENLIRNTNQSDSNIYYLADAETGQIFASGAAAESELGNLLLEDQARNGMGSSSISLNGHRYFSEYRELNTSWILLKAMPYTQYEAAYLEKRNELLLIACYIIVAGFGLSYLFSFVIYLPWRSMFKKYGFFMKSVSGKGVYDEYALVGDGVNRLLVENQQICSTIEQMTPLLKHKLVYDVLHGHNGSGVSVPEHMFSKYGIVFPNSLFIVCLASYESKQLEKRDDAESVRLLLFSLLENEFAETYHTAGTWLDDSQFAFILNVSEDIEVGALQRDFVELCRRINELIDRELGVTMRFSFGRLCKEFSEIPSSYSAARRSLQYRALYGKVEVIFGMEEERSSTYVAYPSSLQRMLVKSVLEGDRLMAEEALGLLFSQYVDNEQISPANVQETIMVLIGVLINELLQAGFALEEFRDIQFLQWHECDNKQELKDFLSSRIGKLIDRVIEDLPDTPVNDYVLQAIRFIENRYMDNISISDIADEIRLTPNYLSRIFKSETGIPPLEYLTRYRIGKAKELMQHPSRYTLKEIGGLVGFSDTHSFIRFFKKHETVTPGMFRRLEMDKIR